MCRSASEGKCRIILCVLDVVVIDVAFAAVVANFNQSKVSSTRFSLHFIYLTLTIHLHFIYMKLLEYLCIAHLYDRMIRIRFLDSIFIGFNMNILSRDDYVPVAAKSKVKLEKTRIKLKTSNLTWLH